jgi:hypothetical protein
MLTDQKVHHDHTQGTLFQRHLHPPEITSSTPPQWTMQDQFLQQRQKHNPGQTEREHKMYDQLDETQTFQVADSFFSFAWTF